MSLTHPNTPVSQQDLQDFYHKILPYMGGSFEMVANKFSKGDLYSTDEKMVGQWVDGKPVYQKTIVGTISSPSIEFTPIGASVDKVVFIRGIAFVNGQASLLPFFNDAINVKVALTVNTDSVSSNKNSVFCYATSNSPMVGQLYFATIQYTKTTDSAISIGNDTDYSTDEKIIGTWIDGKPVYQKSYDFGALPNATTKEISSGLSGIKILDMKIIANNSSYSMSIPYIATGSNTVTAYYSYDTNKIGITATSDRSSFEAFITIQYTKTI